MCDNNKFYICEKCGNLVGMINESGVPMMCCGQKMTKLQAGVVEASHEKHIPVVSVEGNTVTVRESLSAISRMPFFRYETRYSFFADGRCEISLAGKVRENCIWLPRLGMEFSLKNCDDAFRYYGRGDKENYCDMQQHARIGLYESTADDEYVPYIMPQEHGNHIDTKYLYMKKSGLAFESDKGFEFAVSHLDSLMLMRAMHTDEIVPAGKTVVRIDYKGSGIGSNSCGPVLLPEYTISEQKISFSFNIKPIFTAGTDGFAEYIK